MKSIDKFSSSNDQLIIVIVCCRRKTIRCSLDRLQIPDLHIIWQRQRGVTNLVRITDRGVCVLFN